MDGRDGRDGREGWMGQKDEADGTGRTDVASTGRTYGRTDGRNFHTEGIPPSMSFEVKMPSYFYGHSV